MHMKRLAVPKTWPIPKKIAKFIIVPRGKCPTYSIALAVILRDFLKEVKTRKEARKVIKEGNVEVNGKVVKDEKFAVGLFDKIYIKKLEKYFTLEFKGKKLGIVEIPKEKYLYKVCKIVGKKSLKKDKVQLNFFDGNLIVEAKKAKEVKIGDSVVLNLKTKKIEKILPLEKNATVVVIKGRSLGKKGKILEIKDKVARVQIEKEIKEIPKENLFVIENEQ